MEVWTDSFSAELAEGLDGGLVGGAEQSGAEAALIGGGEGYHLLLGWAPPRPGRGRGAAWGRHGGRWGSEAGRLGEVALQRLHGAPAAHLALAVHALAALAVHVGGAAAPVTGALGAHHVAAEVRDRSMRAVVRRGGGLAEGERVDPHRLHHKESAKDQPEVESRHD